MAIIFLREIFLFYFGYGSNMSINYLKNFRKINPVSSFPVVLEDYKLIMNMPGPNFIEPNFANIVSSFGNKVEGILHEVSDAELEKIMKSEGEDYQVVDLEVLRGKKIYSAKTLMFKSNIEEDLPSSRRYLRILIKAAIAGKLSDKYISSLRARKSVYYPLLSDLFAIRVFLWVWSRSR